VLGSDVYAGWKFNSTNGFPNRVARWDGSSWVAVGTGMDNEVFRSRSLRDRFDRGREVQQCWRCRRRQHCQMERNIVVCYRRRLRKSGSGDRRLWNRHLRGRGSWTEFSGRYCQVEWNELAVPWAQASVAPRLRSWL
jgi:hypothetical protein